VTDDPDQLITLTSASTEFAAQIAATVLREAGIETFVFGSTGTAMGLSMTGAAPLARGGDQIWGVPVQVRRRDFDRARELLQANRRDSVDIDWNQVEVGQREDTLPLGETGRIPFPARIALGVALAVMMLGIVLAGIALFN